MCVLGTVKSTVASVEKWSDWLLMPAMATDSRYIIVFAYFSPFICTNEYNNTDFK